MHLLQDCPPFTQRNLMKDEAADDLVWLPSRGQVEGIEKAIVPTDQIRPGAKLATRDGKCCRIGLNAGETRLRTADHEIAKQGAGSAPNIDKMIAGRKIGGADNRAPPCPLTRKQGDGEVIDRGQPGFAKGWREGSDALRSGYPSHLHDAHMIGPVHHLPAEIALYDERRSDQRQKQAQRASPLSARSNPPGEEAQYGNRRAVPAVNGEIFRPVQQSPSTRKPSEQSRNDRPDRAAGYEKPDRRLKPQGRAHHQGEFGECGDEEKRNREMRRDRMKARQKVLCRGQAVFRDFLLHHVFRRHGLLRVRPVHLFPGRRKLAGMGVVRHGHTLLHRQHFSVGHIVLMPFMRVQGCRKQKGCEEGGEAKAGEYAHMP